ncbi:MAG: L-threonylcarbamoyladenylate synthase [Casimicrobiaceae bacterium]
MARLARDLDEALAALRAGRLVAMPTETVYGLAGDASRPESVARIFALKGRPADHPLIVHVASLEMARAWSGAWPEAAERLGRAFWPGPLTLIVPKAPAVLEAVTGGQASVGLRVPAHPLAQTLLAVFGGGLAAPSANRFGRVSPTTAEHVLDEFRAIDDLLVLDGGACEVGVESTIVDLTGARARILRPGRIRAAQIEAALAGALDTTLAGAPRASGTLTSHYAPSRPTFAFAGEALAIRLQAMADAGKRVGLIHHGEVACAVARSLRLPAASPLAWEHDLYAALRTLDQDEIDVIVIETPPIGPEWDAVQDRLRRATAHGAPAADATGRLASI